MSTQPLPELHRRDILRLAGSAVVPPPVGADRTHVYHLYVVRHAQREALAEYLKLRGIGTGLHYPLPLHLQKAYAYLGLSDGASGTVTTPLALKLKACPTSPVAKPAPEPREPLFPPTLSLASPSAGHQRLERPATLLPRGRGE